MKVLWIIIPPARPRGGCLLPNRQDAWKDVVTAAAHSDAVSDDELFELLYRMLQEIRFMMTQFQYWVDVGHNVAGFMIRVLVALTDIFSDFTESVQWKKDAVRWLGEYLSSGFYPDGLYKELTLGYSSSCVEQSMYTIEVLLDHPDLARLREKILNMNVAMIGLCAPLGRGSILRRCLRAAPL